MMNEQIKRADLTQSSPYLADTEGESIVEELRPLGSLEQLAHECAEVLSTPSLEPQLSNLLTDLEAIPHLDGLALVISQQQHLSINAFTELNRKNPTSVQTVTSIGAVCSSFDTHLREGDSRLSSSLSFFNTKEVGIDPLIPKLEKQWRAEDTTSFIAVITK